ncbi:ribonuclease I [Buttiauxella selenatireducens]|uniref:Ribonuclease I n=1 Tax=Buttiauxella selenatireducens TaxID=3073902 RepID=A0ABY9SA43_9ENTR|nr:ribonuclease I [Buttiauxella sp. R73]WMY73311.1 ribonuclease I [Buttiauxella sp. R73]
MKFICQTTLLTLACAASFHSMAEDLQPKQYGDFDRYVLALSWQTGFCQSMHERNRDEPAECKTQQEQNDKRAFLTVHGLWPGLPKSVASRGVDEKRWMRYGCSTRPVPNMAEVRGSQKCQAPAPELSPDIASKLAGVMPGAGGKSCLERYEFAKHGACFGFNPNAYFGTMVRLNSEFKQSAFGTFLAENYGNVVTRKAFNKALEKSWGTEAVKAVKLTCNGNPAYLTEMQISLDAGKINGPLNESAFAAQKNPGNCAKQFRLDAVGY